MKNSDPSVKGVSIAVLIIALWSTNLALLVTFFKIDTWELYPLILIQSFLNIGLFITAHDSMHGTLAPRWPKLNNVLGYLALILYAGFSFKKLKSQHVLHHLYPASNQDPDYARNQDERFWYWISGFIRHYFGMREFFIMVIPVTLISLLTQSYVTMLLIYALPSMTSALQLFYFGTFLPHRTPEGGHTHPHRTTSNAYPTWLSFITCYHFGYHQEHHENPGVPWWGLPKLYQNKTQT